MDEGAPAYVAIFGCPQTDLPRPLSFQSILATHDLSSISGVATHYRGTFSESQSLLGPTISNNSFHPLPWTFPWETLGHSLPEGNISPRPPEKQEKVSQWALVNADTHNWPKH